MDTPPPIEKPQLTHPRFCKCKECCNFFGEEFAQCSILGCTYIQWDDCEEGYCYNHHTSRCDF